MNMYTLALSENSNFWLNINLATHNRSFIYGYETGWKLAQFTLDEAVEYVKSHPEDKLDIVCL